MSSTNNVFHNAAMLGAPVAGTPDAQIGTPNGAFHELSDEQLDAVSGAGLWSWLKGAAEWVGSHFGYSGTDMTGTSATIISVKGTWRGNP